MILLAIAVRLADVATSFQKNFEKKKKKDVETLCLLHQDLMHATEFRPLFL